MKEDAGSIRRAQVGKIEQLQMEAQRKKKEAEEAEMTKMVKAKSIFAGSV